MPMEREEIIRLIKDYLPDAVIEVEDLREDGDHYAVRVESAAFAGQTLPDQHRMVFTALQGRVGGVLRSLTLTTAPIEGSSSEKGEQSAPNSKPRQNIDPNIVERIRADVNANDVVLYMKGTPVFPQCSFSAQAVQILGILGVTFKSVDVLVDPMIRQGIRDFSNWPTIPQLYVRGAFVGGADVIRQMFESGDLQKLFADCKIAYTE
jgi:monothiol glutaredoxin